MKRVMLLKCNSGKNKGEIRESQIYGSKKIFFHTDDKYLKELDKKLAEKLEIKQDNFIIIYLLDKVDSSIVKNIFYGNFHAFNSGETIKIDKLKEFSQTDIEFVNKICIGASHLTTEKISDRLEFIKVDDKSIEDIKEKIEGIGYTYDIKNGKYSSICPSKINPKVLKSYERLEYGLHELAQRSMYAKRVIGERPPVENRTEFQRDWERIIHSKAFRRLEDKAQIYTASKGNHFRTRLTHTLEVTQIARGLARELKINEDLVEAIALAHDIGHTPFGHVGERALNDILKKDTCCEENGEKIYHGGFKHNFQGVRVVNYLEEKYPNFEGLDLTYQVIEGILKHTKISKHKNKQDCDACTNKCYNIEEFMCKGDIENLHMDYLFATTLEGQVVACADEIAQRAHDLDDGIASGIIDIRTFRKQIEGNDILNPLSIFVEDNLIDVESETREYISKDDIERANIVSSVITYFMRELKKSSDKNMKEYLYRFKKSLDDENTKISDLNEIIIKEKVIDFDEPYNKMIDELKKITSNKVINSEEVNCFDGKSEYLVKKLYKAYFTNPRQLPKGTITRIYREITKFTNNCVNIRDGESEEVAKEIEIYKGNTITNEEDLMKHKLFIRSIVDLISGMTDEFARKQFEKLYIP